MTDFGQFQQSPADKAAQKAENLVEQFVQRGGQSKLRFDVALEDKKSTHSSSLEH